MTAAAIHEARFSMLPLVEAERIITTGRLRNEELAAIPELGGRCPRARDDFQRTCARSTGAVFDGQRAGLARRARIDRPAARARRGAPRAVHTHP